MCHVATLTLPCAATSPAQARQFLRAELETWLDGRTEVEDASLVSSELVTNAVRYGSDGLTFELRVHRDELELRVTDSNPTLPRRRRAGPDATDGRGLGIVDAVCASCGVEPHPPGKTVWCRLRLCGELHHEIECNH